jgi:hypothetical protein
MIASGEILKDMQDCLPLWSQAPSPRIEFGFERRGCVGSHINPLKKNPLLTIIVTDMTYLQEDLLIEKKSQGFIEHY